LITIIDCFLSIIISPLSWLSPDILAIIIRHAFSDFAINITTLPVFFAEAPALMPRRAAISLIRHYFSPLFSFAYATPFSLLITLFTLSPFRLLTLFHDG